MFTKVHFYIIEPVQKFHVLSGEGITRTNSTSFTCPNSGATLIGGCKKDGLNAKKS